MANDSVQKAVILGTAFLAVIGVGLIVASFATDHWIVSHPLQKQTNNATNSNATTNGRSAIISFGLFIGYRSMNYGFGDRTSSTKIECDISEHACAFIGKKLDVGLRTRIDQYKNQTNGEDKSMEAFGLFDFRLYVATLVMLVLALIWGLITIGFSIFNVFGRPIETITGRSGLYVWNLFALVFDVIAIAIYVGLYFSQLKENILPIKEMISGFSSKDETDLDYSFFFLIGTAGAFLLNLILLAIANRGCSCSYAKAGEKEVDNGMILY